MAETKIQEDMVNVDVENLGGIDQTSVEFSPGVTILTGRNATNRTSFLRSIMAALGSDAASLKADADEGSVELQIGDTGYTRFFTRDNGQVIVDGDPYLDGTEVELADLFAFLLESNDARRTAVLDEDLREVVMRPVDTNAIEADIERLQARKRELTEELDDLGEAERRRDELRTKRTEIEATLKERREELESIEAELEEVDVEEERETKSELETKLDELREARRSLDGVRDELETEERSLEALEEEKTELTAELEAIGETDTQEIERIDDELRTLRDRQQSIDSDVSKLQQIIKFNEETLDGRTGIVNSMGQLEATQESGTVTDQLVENGQSVVCWTCGSAVDSQTIEETVDGLRELSAEKIQERKDIKARISELEDQRDELAEQVDRRERLEQRLEEITEELTAREGRIDTLQERRAGLSDDVEALEAEVDAFETDEFGEALDLHREVTQLEVEIDRLEDDKGRIEAEIENLEERLEQRDHRETQLENVQTQLDERRTRIERIENRAVEAFNEHMDTVLGLLDYENIERIWVERVERDDRDGRRSATEGAFDLHVIRRSEDDTHFEDDIDHLSESEREVTGLVFALAGYLAHDVDDSVPFMLLDSLESLDAERIATLVDYFSDHAKYLVVALLPEDASALDDRYERITSI